jgi:hypothetical protein
MEYLEKHFTKKRKTVLNLRAMLFCSHYLIKLIHSYSNMFKVQGDGTSRRAAARPTYYFTNKTDAYVLHKISNQCSKCQILITIISRMIGGYNSNSSYCCPLESRVKPDWQHMCHNNKPLKRNTLFIGSIVITHQLGLPAYSWGKRR